MKTKSLLTSLLLTFLLFQVYSQERVNREKLSFSEVSGTLSNATGWAYNTTLGEWIDYKNVISDDKDYKTKNAILKGSWMMSKVSKNFINMQIKTITFKGETYYVLIINKWSGSYEYPALEMDWQPYKITIGYIYTKEEYSKLKNIENIIEVKTKYLVCIGSKYRKYNEKTFLDLIQTELNKEIDSIYFPPTTEYIFPLMKTKEGAIRFLLPNSSILSEYSKSGFEKEYFETNFVDFSNLLIKED
jgi:hypothetical protein